MLHVSIDIYQPMCVLRWLFCQQDEIHWHCCITSDVSFELWNIRWVPIDKAWSVHIEKMYSLTVVWSFPGSWNVSMWNIFIHLSQPKCWGEMCRRETYLYTYHNRSVEERYRFTICEIKLGNILWFE
jgi:hypothetical protein